MRLVEHRRGLEPLAIEVQRRVELKRGEMRSESEWQAEMRGKAGAEQAGAEDPQVHRGAGARRRHDRHRLAGKARLQFDDVLRKALGGFHQVAPQRLGDALVGARRAAEAKVDAAGKQRVERAELLGDDQRIVVGQHDAPRADADGRSGLADMGERNRGRAAGNAFHAVMLGNPEAAIADFLSDPGQRSGLGERLRHGAAFAHGHEIENRKRDHREAGSVGLGVGVAAEAGSSCAR